MKQALHHSWAELALERWAGASDWLAPVTCPLPGGKGPWESKALAFSGSWWKAGGPPPALTHGMGNTPHSKRGLATKSSTHPVPLMISISPSFLLEPVVKLQPFPRTGEGGRASAPCHNSRGSGPMAQALSPRCQPNAKHVSCSWVAVQSTRPCLGWRACTAAHFISFCWMEEKSWEGENEQGKGVQKMFLMCIRLCSQARGLCPASRHVPA